LYRRPRLLIGAIIWDQNFGFALTALIIDLIEAIVRTVHPRLLCRHAHIKAGGPLNFGSDNGHRNGSAECSLYPESRNHRAQSAVLSGNGVLLGLA